MRPPHNYGRRRLRKCCCDHECIDRPVTSREFSRQRAAWWRWSGFLGTLFPHQIDYHGSVGETADLLLLNQHKPLRRRHETSVKKLVSEAEGMIGANLGTVLSATFTWIGTSETIQHTIIRTFAKWINKFSRFMHVRSRMDIGVCIISLFES